MHKLSPIVAIHFWPRLVIGLFSERRAQDQAGPYVWIGNFRITLSNPATYLFSKTSLGIYPTESFFLDQRDAEIRSREELLRAQLSERNMTQVVEKIELLSIEKLPIR